MVLGVLIIGSVVRQKSKMLTFFNFTFMWIIFTFNYGNADYAAYIQAFASPQMTTEVGFSFLCKFFNNLDLTYNYMLGFIGGVCLILLLLTFKRMTDNTALASALYMITPFFVDAIQIRNFIMMAIVLYCMKYLDENQSKKNTLFFCIGVCIASTFHILAIVYLLLPFIRKLSLKKTVYLGVLGAAAILVSYEAFRLLIPKLEFYSGGVEMWKAALFCMPYIIFFLIGLYVYQNYENKKISPNLKHSIIQAMIYLFMYNILLLKSLNFHRIFRIFIPLLEVQYTQLFRTKMNKHQFIYLLTLSCLFIFNFVRGWEEKAALLTNNYVFDLLVL